MMAKVEPGTGVLQRLCKRAAAVRLPAPVKSPSARSQFHQSATVVQATDTSRGVSWRSAGHPNGDVLKRSQRRHRSGEETER